MAFYLETDKLIIRDICANDVSGIFELDSDPEVRRYLGLPPITTMQEAEAIVDYILNQYLENGIGRWAVLDRKTGEFIGWSGLKLEKEVRDDMDYYDLGYRLKRKFWGQGIATITGKLALQYTFQNMNLTEIFAGAHIKNTGSNKVLNKLGFEFIETFYYDSMPHNWYGITMKQWSENPTLEIKT